MAALDRGAKDVLPNDTINAILTHGVALKGPCTTPIGGGFSSINVALRKTLHLYGAVRPVRSLKGVQTRYDEVVTPHTSAFLAGGDNTANILLQDTCPAEVIDHHFIPHSQLALRWTLQALGRPGPASPEHPPSCA